MPASDDFQCVLLHGCCCTTSLPGSMAIGGQRWQSRLRCDPCLVAGALGCVRTSRLPLPGMAQSFASRPTSRGRARVLGFTLPSGALLLGKLEVYLWLCAVQLRATAVSPRMFLELQSDKREGSSDAGYVEAYAADKRQEKIIYLTYHTNTACSAYRVRVRRYV